MVATANAARTNNDLSKDVTSVVIEKLKLHEFGFQSTRIFSAPIKLTGESIPSISFSLLSNPDSSDNRWCSFNEAKKFGFKLKANSHSSKAVLEKTVLTQGAYGDKITAISFYPLFNFSSFYAAEPNAQARVPKLERRVNLPLDNVVFVGQALGFIINDPRDPTTIDLIANGTNGLIEIRADMADAELASTLLYSMAAITRPEVRPDDDDHHIRSLMVEAMATSMMCAEYGVGCPQFMVDLVNNNIDVITQYLEQDSMNIISIAKSAWAIRGHIIQYTPANISELKEAGVDANTIATYPGELFAAPKNTL